MITRLALAIGGLAAAAVLAVGLTAAGSGPSAAPAVDAAPSSLDVSGSGTSEAVTRVQTERVYVRPAPSPRIIHVTRRAEPTRSSITRRVVPAYPSDGERDDGEREGGERAGGDD